MAHERLLLLLYVPCIRHVVRADFFNQFWVWLLFMSVSLTGCNRGHQISGGCDDGTQRCLDRADIWQECPWFLWQHCACLSSMNGQTVLIGKLLGEQEECDVTDLHMAASAGSLDEVSNTTCKGDDKTIPFGPRHASVSHCRNAQVSPQGVSTSDAAGKFN